MNNLSLNIPAHAPVLPDHAEDIVTVYRMALESQSESTGVNLQSRFVVGVSDDDAGAYFAPQTIVNMAYSIIIEVSLYVRPDQSMKWSCSLVNPNDLIFTRIQQIFASKFNRLVTQINDTRVGDTRTVEFASDAVLDRFSNSAKQTSLSDEGKSQLSQKKL